MALSCFCFGYGSCRYGDGLVHAAITVVGVVLLHFLLAGAALASACCFLSNRYLREESGGHTHAVEQKVEWLYAFDVHCNSYFPLFILLYVLQYFMSPLLVAPGIVPALLSNVLYATALSYYHYLNFLGYDGTRPCPRSVTFTVRCMVRAMLQ
eukprot:jgi/Mesen1/274/ME1151993C09511